MDVRAVNYMLVEQSQIVAESSEYRWGVGESMDLKFQWEGKVTVFLRAYMIPVVMAWI